MSAIRPTEKNGVHEHSPVSGERVVAPVFLATDERHAGLHLELLRKMVLLREVDRRQGILVRQGQGGHHISSRGHEPLMAVTHLLQAEDTLFPYYRSYHLLIGRGLGIDVIARDFFGKATSTSEGRSVSAHTNSPELGIFPSVAPTGAQCTPAVGSAWAHQLCENSAIAVCSIGEGATREGEFYEAVCLAVERRLPILFLIEDNGYAISTPTRNKSPLGLGVFREDLFWKVDARNAIDFLPMAEKAIGHVRSGAGPLILWCQIDRLEGHTANDDQILYRGSEEVRGLSDPTEHFAQALGEMGILPAGELDRLVSWASEEVRRVYVEAKTDPEPSPVSIMDHLYGRTMAPSTPPLASTTEGTTMVDATNRVLAAGLKAYEQILMFGQDIEDPKGGVFGFTKGLSTQFPGRVINAPIAETSIIGAAVGLAAAGFKPVFEIQFVDFLTPAFDQLVSQVASLRWRSAGRWSCPMVIYAPYGAYVPSGGLWHSQSNDGWWAHIPGLRVAIPSTPADIAGLFWSAFQDEDPSLILIPKHLFRIRHSPVEYGAVPFGKARFCRMGTDVTVVAWGNGRELAELAAEQLAKEELSVEVIDLRTLVPCDWEAVETSVAKTGRLVVVHEDNRTCGFGASVIAEMVGSVRRFEHLAAPPRLVAREDVHIPFHPKLEEAVLPSVADVVRAIRETADY
ncbi:MAG TPA: thiamine pyrophosphate-dependent enzyme [Candidatus Limnocylindria bacterium]|nr:thiamine pyrophosphate-dependent enzyme [Candidatus Limnocylindria bacterium]